MECLYGKKNTFTHFCHFLYLVPNARCMTFEQRESHTSVISLCIRHSRSEARHLSTVWCSLLVSPGPRHCRTAARPGSHEPPPAQRWPGSTRLSLPPWAGHLGGRTGGKYRGNKRGTEREREGSESVMWKWWYWREGVERREGGKMAGRAVMAEMRRGEKCEKVVNDEGRGEKIIS